MKKKDRFTDFCSWNFTQTSPIRDRGALAFEAGSNRSPALRHATGPCGTASFRGSATADHPGARGGGTAAGSGVPGRLPGPALQKHFRKITYTLTCGFIG
ncbi:hypothetical protein GCM10017559_43670 [Streptosporangium longisporum]|uniref:Uncharacterized protein n=1 Tax=Streptosporangium longisporum TaxID=46187 RepID=A0ABP6KN53_9ACTN